MTQQNSFRPPCDLGYYKQLQPDSSVKIKRCSPHQVVLVLINSRSEYERFLIKHNLPRANYRFLHDPVQLVGRGWDNAYLLCVGDWHLSPLLAHEDGHRILDIRFPWWQKRAITN